MGMVTWPNEWGNGSGIVNMCLCILVQMSMGIFGRKEREHLGMSYWEGKTCEMKWRGRERAEESIKQMRPHKLNSYVDVV